MARSANTCTLGTNERHPPGFDWETIPADQIERISRLEPEALVRELLSRDSKMSGAGLREALAECGHDVSKAQCQRWREAWKLGLGHGKIEAGPAPAQGPAGLAEAQSRLADSLAVGDANGAAKWSAIVERLANLPATAGPVTDSADWSRLTGAEVDVLHYLVSKAYGAKPIDEEQALEWDSLARALARLDLVG